MLVWTDSKINLDNVGEIFLYDGSDPSAFQGNSLKYLGIEFDNETIITAKETGYGKITIANGILHKTDDLPIILVNKGIRKIKIKGKRDGSPFEQVIDVDEKGFVTKDWPKNVVLREVNYAVDANSLYLNNKKPYLNNIEITNENFLKWDPKTSTKFHYVNTNFTKNTSKVSIPGFVINNSKIIGEISKFENKNKEEYFKKNIDDIDGDKKFRIIPKRENIKFVASNATQPLYNFSDFGFTLSHNSVSPNFGQSVITDVSKYNRIIIAKRLPGTASLRTTTTVDFRTASIYCSSVYEDWKSLTEQVKSENLRLLLERVNPQQYHSYQAVQEDNTPKVSVEISLKDWEFYEIPIKSLNFNTFYNVKNLCVEENSSDFYKCLVSDPIEKRFYRNINQTTSKFLFSEYPVEGYPKVGFSKNTDYGNDIDITLHNYTTVNDVCLGNDLFIEKDIFTPSYLKFKLYEEYKSDTDKGPITDFDLDVVYFRRRISSSKGMSNYLLINDVTVNTFIDNCQGINYSHLGGLQYYFFNITQGLRLQESKTLCQSYNIIGTKYESSSGSNNYNKYGESTYIRDSSIKIPVRIFLGGGYRPNLWGISYASFISFNEDSNSEISVDDNYNQILMNGVPNDRFSSNKNNLMNRITTRKLTDDNNCLYYIFLEKD